MFEIIDDEGVIYSGSREEMEERFEDMVDDTNAERISWVGDLKLVEVIKVSR